jgi:pimeloyl-ACP methyl ester carboxylesterase
MYKLLLAFAIGTFGCLHFATAQTTQPLKPGFDKKEYISLLEITAHQVDTPWTAENMKTPTPEGYIFTYRSPTLGLENKWDLWLNDKKQAVISIRGTTMAANSWLENFFAAMVPAKGTLNIEPGKPFNYQLADNPRAAVHVGWLLGMAFIANDIVHKIDSCYKSGYHDVILMGHSQGAGITFMMRAYLEQLLRAGSLPKDIRIKTYCSAAPKPGNLYFAYYYEKITANGWGYTVVNTADWVPEVPMSLQTLNDYNPVNPFVNASALISKQKFPKNIVMKLVYNKLRRPGEKLQKRYKRFLGDEAYKMVNAQVKDFQKPEFANTSNYMRAGSPIILMADEAYYRQFPDTSSNVFIHHLMKPYLYLANQLPDQK